jgi:hypothetical protein
MRRRRRAARGPLGGMGGSFILDVILHLELILCQEQILRLQSAMVLVGSGMSLGQDQTTEVINPSGRAVPRGHQGTRRKTLLTNF